MSDTTGYNFDFDLLRLLAVEHITNSCLDKTKEHYCIPFYFILLHEHQLILYTLITIKKHITF